MIDEVSFFLPLNSLPFLFFSLLMIIDVAVRGMMYYRRALKLLAFLDMASEDGKSINASSMVFKQHL